MEKTYSLRDLQSMLGVSPAVVRGLVASGFVTPSRGPRREYRFTFRDVVLLRTACGLQQAHIPARRILRSLRSLKERLPSELPLSGLRISAVGDEIAVKDGDTQWHAESGQLLMDFEVRPQSGSVAFLSRVPQGGADAAAGRAAGPPDAAGWFARGAVLESEDPRGAERAYRQAIDLDPGYVEPVLNLGVMLGDEGRSADAVALYRRALKHAPGSALLHFNLAVALEDLRRLDDAQVHYEATLKLDPKFADAHYNLARLHELGGRPARAIRHYSEYRRLQR